MFPFLWVVLFSAARTTDRRYWLKKNIFVWVRTFFSFFSTRFEWLLCCHRSVTTIISYSSRQKLSLLLLSTRNQWTRSTALGVNSCGLLSLACCRVISKAAIRCSLQSCLCTRPRMTDALIVHGHAQSADVVGFVYSVVMSLLSSLIAAWLLAVTGKLFSVVTITLALVLATSTTVVPIKHTEIYDFYCSVSMFVENNLLIAGQWLTTVSIMCIISFHTNSVRPSVSPSVWYCVNSDLSLLGCLLYSLRLLLQLITVTYPAVTEPGRCLKVTGGGGTRKPDLPEAFQALTTSAVRASLTVISGPSLPQKKWIWDRRLWRRCNFPLS